MADMISISSGVGRDPHGFRAVTTRRESGDARHGGHRSHVHKQLWKAAALAVFLGWSEGLVGATPSTEALQSFEASLSNTDVDYITKDFPDSFFRRAGFYSTVPLACPSESIANLKATGRQAAQWVRIATLITDFRRGDQRHGRIRPGASSWSTEVELETCA